MSRSDPPEIRAVLLLADESAEWLVAGLKQLERALFALAAFARSRGSGPLPVCLWADRAWTDLLSRCARDERMEGLTVTEVTECPATDLVLTTRMFLTPEALPPLHERFQIQRENAEEKSYWDRAWQIEYAGGVVPFLQGEEEAENCANQFFAASGKTQDGLVSRFINRPISRRLSRWLVQKPITPNAWTVLIAILPFLGVACLMRGSYAGFVAGAFLYQIYSVLDGCDGEIARAKYLGSKFGRSLDSACDFGGTLLMLLGLGIGLARARSGLDWADLYIWESVFAVIFLSLNEVLLRAKRPEAVTVSLAGELYERHQNLVAHSGLTRLGPGFTRWLVQATKRDVVLFAFLLLTLSGLPELMLHLHLGFGIVSSALAGKAWLRLRDQRPGSCTGLA